MFHHILNHLMTEHLFSCFLSRKFTWNWWIIEEFYVWLVGQLKIFFRICLFVCFAAISSQGSIFSTSHMKLHFFFFMIFLLLLLWDTFRSQTLWGIIYIFKTFIYEYYICIISIPSLSPPPSLCYVLLNPRLFSYNYNGYIYICTHASSLLSPFGVALTSMFMAKYLGWITYHDLISGENWLFLSIVINFLWLFI